MTSSGLTLRAARLRADGLLLLVAVIWGSAFVVQRLAAAEMGTYLFNGARFLLGALALAPLAFMPRRTAAAPGDVRPLDWRSLPGVALAGLFLVAGAGLQQAGLAYTTAGNAGFITGLYVVLIPIFMALLFRQRPRPLIWLAAGMAVVGLYLLSAAGNLAFNRGDVLELIGAVFWAAHVIITGRLVQRLDVLQFAVGQYVVCGLVSLALGLALEWHTLPALLNGWWAVAYAGLLSVGLGYTLQAVGQRHAPPADAAILLSLEAVFAAFAGWLFLDERLTAAQLLGCGIMLAGMLLAQIGHMQETEAG